MNQIFLACAHAHGSPLPELVEEIRALEKVLSPLRERKIYEILSNRAANVQDIFDTFTANKNIQVFHYAGHADDNTLYLEGAGDIKGVAELFGLNRAENSANHLKLVFLNGCSSRGQVASLHHAGIAAVIATSRPIGDTVAKLFSTQFFQSWITEGKTLKEAFETAQARIHTEKDSVNRDILFSADEIGGGEFQEAIPWGMYLHPQLAAELDIENWVFVKPPQLPAMMLSTIKPDATQSLRELVHEFRKTDAEAKELMQKEQKDPLMVLIERLPWIIGTHLRRLFAVESGHTMTEPGRERLRELIVAYSELTRFVSYLVLSLLWDAKGAGLEIKLLPFEVIPSEADFAATDFVYRIREYYQQLQGLSNIDSLELEPKLEAFLRTVDDEQGLRPAYLLMEEWKQALAAGEERFAELIQSRAAEKEQGEKTLVLEAEAIYARFLKTCLFLTQYKLHTVRSIEVDKIRRLPADRPYSHYTISLHAAFSQLQTSHFERETATDNYCLLLARRGQSGDDLAGAINLSPFYLDRSSFIGGNTSNYPAVFALDYYREKGYDKEYVFHYIDRDINHDYAFARDNELIIDPYGVVLPEHLEVGREASERFEKIYEQLELLHGDLPYA